MRPGPRRVLLFVAQFAPLFLVSLWLYATAVPAYRSAVFGVANGIMGSLPEASRIETLANGTWHAYRIGDGGERSTIYHWQGYTTHLLFLSLALLPALILATPAPPAARFRLLAIGLALLFVVHVAAAIALVREMLCLVERPGTFHCLWILRLVYASGQISGALLWGLLTWRYWFPERPGPASGPPPVAAILLLLALPAIGGCGPGRGERPNLIVIVVDTLRADHLGSYGFPAEISPNLDAWAAEAWVFDNAFSQAPWTKPSTASLFTSLYPQVHRVTEHEGRNWGKLQGVQIDGEKILAPEAVTLAEALADDGYVTGAFVANPFVAAAFGFDQGFETYEVRTDFTDNRADHLAGAALDWLAGHEPDQPFFLYLHVMDVHAPYDAPHDDHVAMGRAIASETTLAPRQRPDRMFHNIEVPAEWANEGMRHRVDYWRTRYAAGVRQLDRRLGPFLNALVERGLDTTSYVVLTSDHGEELFEHDSWSHGYTLYDHQLHVPLLIRAPGGEGGGRRVGDLVEMVDLMPTLLSLAGIEAPPGLQGRDLAPLWSGKPLPSLAETFAGAGLARPAEHSARTLDHKLILDVDTGDPRLFDLHADPGEHHDTASARPRVAAGLAARIRTHLTETVADGVLEPGEADIPPELLESIEALGYVGGGGGAP